MCLINIHIFLISINYTKTLRVIMNKKDPQHTCTCTHKLSSYMFGEYCIAEIDERVNESIGSTANFIIASLSIHVHLVHEECAHASVIMSN